MNFYTKVLTKYAANKGLKLTVQVELDGNEPISQQSIDETKTALRELGAERRRAHFLTSTTDIPVRSATAESQAHPH